MLTLGILIGFMMLAVALGRYTRPSRYMLYGGIALLALAQAGLILYLMFTMPVPTM